MAQPRGGGGGRGVRWGGRGVRWGGRGGICPPFFPGSQAFIAYLLFHDKLAKQQYIAKYRD